MSLDQKSIDSLLAKNFMAIAGCLTEWRQAFDSYSMRQIGPKVLSGNIADELARRGKKSFGGFFRRRDVTIASTGNTQEATEALVGTPSLKKEC